MKKLLLIGTTFIFLNSCTQNERAKYFGGTQNIILKQNEILLNVTWKKDNIWVLTKDTITHINYFREHSSWGVVEGEIILK